MSMALWQCPDPGAEPSGHGPCVLRLRVKRLPSLLDGFWGLFLSAVKSLCDKLALKPGRVQTQKRTSWRMRSGGQKPGKCPQRERAHDSTPGLSRARVKYPCVPGLCANLSAPGGSGSEVLRPESVLKAQPWVWHGKQLGEEQARGGQCPLCPQRSLCAGYIPGSQESASRRNSQLKQAG